MDTEAVMADQKLMIDHVFDAPRELVWAAWTEPEHLAAWWGPASFTTPTCLIDVRPGGQIRIDMKGPDGTVYPMTGEFTEVLKPERLVFIAAPLDAAGEKLFEVLYTADFSASSARKTLLRLTTDVISTTPGATRYLAGMEPGWNQSLEKLGRLLHTLTAGGTAE